MAGALNAGHNSWLNRSFYTRGTFFKKWLGDNEIKYKLKLYTSSLPSYARAEFLFMLDLCIADTRLEISELNKTSKLETFECDSDHNPKSKSTQDIDNYLKDINESIKITTNNTIP